MKLLPIVLMLALFSCKSFTPSKDPSQQVAKLNVKIETKDFYNALAVGSKAYKSQPYEAIAAEIQAICAVDSIRKNAGDLFKQDKLVRAAWLQRWQYHATKGVLKPAEITSEAAYMKSYWDAVLRAELSLK